MMRGMGIRNIVTAPFPALASLFRTIWGFRSKRRAKKFARTAELAELRFSRMSKKAQEEVIRARNRFSS
jgi:hypothetical protein